LLDGIEAAAREAALEICAAAGLTAGQVVIVGCSTSEIAGRRIGSCSNAEIGEAVFRALYGVFAERGLLLAAQCCEHLNRAVIVEREAAAGFEIVNAVPAPGAGGAFAAAAYAGFRDPVAVEEFRADAGLDIGHTLIGMHLKRVAVPLRLKTTHVGEAPIVAARTRPKLIGGARARYDESLLR
jgi:uncharacterized protein (TIGR01440 family)